VFGPTTALTMPRKWQDVAKNRNLQVQIEERIKGN
jgi:hypothetical protein